MSSNEMTTCHSCGASTAADAARCEWCLTKLTDKTAQTASAAEEPIARRSKPSWDYQAAPPNPPTAAAQPEAQAAPPTPGQTQSAQPAAPPYIQTVNRGKNWPVRLLSIINFCISLFLLLIIIGMVMTQVDNTAIGGAAIFWMLLHTVFAIFLIITARPASMTRRLSIIHLVLNLVLIGAFIVVIVAVVASMSSGSFSLESVQVISGVIVLLWFVLALFAPLVLLIVSLFDKKYSKTRNMQQMTTVLQ